MSNADLDTDTRVLGPVPPATKTRGKRPKTPVIRRPTSSTPINRPARRAQRLPFAPRGDSPNFRIYKRFIVSSARSARPLKRAAPTAKAALAAGQPVVISVDSKKREFVGNFKAVGREWAPKGGPVEVSTHDFKDKELGHAIPHGIFDPLANEGWVTVGIDREISQFAVNSIRRSVRGGSTLVASATRTPRR